MGSFISRITSKSHIPSVIDISVIDRTVTPSSNRPKPVRDSPQWMRGSQWTCRFPVEIMENICDHLSDAHASRTLASLQETSSAFYSLTTPYLYRHIAWTTRQALLFVQLFKTGTWSTSHCQTVARDAHLMDEPTNARLRAFMSRTAAWISPRKQAREWEIYHGCGQAWNCRWLGQ